ncbi:hypothetical protein T265_14574, partial [Opisthorchis viverrini]
VSWNDSSECQNYSGYHYTVTIYDTDNHRLIEQNTTDRSFTVEDLDWCSQYWVHIQAIGPTGLSNESTLLKYQESVAPMSPTNIQLRSTGPQKWLIAWNDDTDCQNSAAYHYVVITYDQKQQIVNKLNVSDRQTTLDGLDGCSEYWVTIRAIGIEGPSNESRAVKIHSTSAPSAPTDIQIRKYEQTKLMVSWNDSSECRNYSGHHYTVAVYDNQMQLVDELNTTDLSVTLVDLDLCSEYWVTVRAVGPGGHSNESGAVKIDAVSAPDKPTDIQLHRLEHTKWMVSWNDSSECQNYSGYHYTVTIYDTDNHRLIEQNTTDRSFTVEDLDWCSQYWVHIQAIGPTGLSNESTLLKYQESVAPMSPTNIQLRSTGPQKWLIAWNDDTDCQNSAAYHYVVITYDQKQQIVNKLNVSDRQTTLDGLDGCSEYWVTIRAIGIEGPSNESRAVKIHSTSAPSAPTDIQIRKYEQTKLMVSWNDSSECQNYSGYHYTVTIYDTDNHRLIEQNTTDRSFTVEDLDWCSQYWVHIQAIGPTGLSNESTLLKYQESVGVKSKESDPVKLYEIP